MGAGETGGRKKTQKIRIMVAGNPRRFDFHFHWHQLQSRSLLCLFVYLPLRSNCFLAVFLVSSLTSPRVKKKKRLKRSTFFLFKFFFKGCIGLFYWFVFVAANRTFSRCSEQGHYSWASRLCGFPCCGEPAPGHLGSSSFITWAQQSWLVGLVVVGHELSRSMPCAIFPDQGWNSRALHCKVDSQPPDHQRSPEKAYSEVVEESSSVLLKNKK